MQDSTSAPSDERQPYEAPELVVIGSVMDLTRSTIHGKKEDALMTGSS